MDDRTMAMPLLASHICSVEELDTLLLPRSESRRFTAQEVARSLRVSAREADTILQALVSRGLASKTASGTRFELTDSSLEPALLAIARWNRADRPELVVTLSRAALSRFRSGAHLFIDTSGDKKR